MCVPFYSNRINKDKRHFPECFEDLVLQLILHWFDTSTVKDVKESMKKTTWRLHTNKKRRKGPSDETGQTASSKNPKTGTQVSLNDCHNGKKRIIVFSNGFIFGTGHH